jgi:hypothetical protein
MSWSIVRTCRRCGARAELEIRDLEAVAATTRVLEHHFAHPGSDDGCPACDPALLEDAKQRGIDLGRYGDAVEAARRNRSS